VDGSGVEGMNSCLKVMPTAVNWTTANASCAALGNGITLLSTRQVRDDAYVCICALFL
jgi:hypothetical protein